MNLIRLGKKAERRLLPVRRGALVLAYHRIADPASAPGADPWNLCVAPDHFQDHMEYVASLGCVTSLQDLAEGLANGEEPGRRIAVTFDDGYVDNLNHALPVLQRLGIPATVFFVAGNRGGVFWWDRLAALVERADPTIPLQLELAGRSLTWSGDADGGVLLDRLHRALRVLPDETRMALLDRLVDLWDVDEPNGLPRALNDDEAQALLVGGLIEPGGHTVSHPPLTEIPLHVARTEIESGRLLLQERFNRSIDAFAYPHGSAGRGTIRLVRASGFRLACLADSGSVRRGVNPLRVPRMWIDNWTGAEFRRQVHRYLTPDRGHQGA